MSSAVVSISASAGGLVVLGCVIYQWSVFLPLLVDYWFSDVSSAVVEYFYLCWWTNGSPDVSSQWSVFLPLWWTMVLGSIIYPVVGISTSAGGLMVLGCVIYPVVGISTLLVD
ncbi:MAG: hypothetical protein H0A75_08430 [Candidatus Methanofishera endochildressiae]|uniref:Uncharacterized protein n=1 Tax=Candidatus Methanofishera endochildressiae TaxID=2738884 RepID=A0A7Z0MPP2_9GAMM|nr:hypothetical protein [Candidatus Methanofishera endochildressiae]